MPRQSLIPFFFLLVMPFMLTACANREPITLSTQYQPSAAAVSPATSKEATVCRVQLGAVVDKRSDAESMGSIGGRAVRAVDSAAWLRSGLESLGRDGRIVLVEVGEASDLELKAELLKGYVMSMAAAKTADVALQVHISRRGGLDTDRVYRGTDEAPNWIAGDEETQGALNRALAQALAQIRTDLLARCGVISRGSGP
jgi:hypothetical protein